MKKRMLAVLAAVSCLALGGQAFAKDTGGKGGFSGPSVEIITVENAKGMEDDTFVILRGNITKSLGDDMYIFTDGTGTINIEIDEDEWNGVTVGPEDVVEIRGEIDKGWASIEIDVDQIKKVNK